MNTACGFCSKSLEGFRETPRSTPRQVIAVDPSGGMVDFGTIHNGFSMSARDYSVKCPNCGEYWRVTHTLEFEKVTGPSGKPMLNGVTVKNVEAVGKLEANIWVD